MGKLKVYKNKRVISILLTMVMIVTIITPILTENIQKVRAENSVDSVSKLQINAGGDEGITADVVNKWIDKTRPNSPLAKKGQLIIDVADKYGVNRAVIIGVMTNETALGTTGTGKNNNFGGFKGSYKFDTPEEGVDAVGELIGKYIRKEIGTAKNPTMQQFLDTYSPSYDNNSHANMFGIHGSVYNALGVTAKGMQQSGRLKNGDPSIEVDYSVSGSDGSSNINVTEACPINCDLNDNQRVSDTDSGSDTGKIRVLEKGKLWKNEEDLTETDLGYTSDKTTESTLELFLDDIVNSSDIDNVEYAEYFYEAGKTSGIDPRFLVAFWSVQTDNGTKEAWQEAYNAFGWDTGEGFDSEKAGIIEGAKLISVNYYNEGQKTVKKMVEDSEGHVVSGDEDWAKSVAALMEKSEEFIEESDGKVQEMYDEAEEYDDWVYEQCFGESGASNKGVNISGDTPVERIINGFREEGFTDEAIAGILGNLRQESGVEPRKLQRHYGEKSLNYTDEERDHILKNHIDGAYGAGMAQWEATRFARVRAVATEMNTSPYTFEPQYQVLIDEMKEYPSRSYGKDGEKLYDLYQYTDMETASESFAAIYEVCAKCKPGGGEFEKRLNYAKEYYNKYF